MESKENLTPDHSDEFKAQFGEVYGINMGKRRPDYAKCAQEVPSQWSWGQCSRKNGHGPHGAWCKQHDPIAVKAKGEARLAKWEAEWNESRRKSEFVSDCQAAIRQIAAGHNDPRGLAQSIIDKLEGKE